MGNSRAQTEHAQVRASTNSRSERHRRLTLHAHDPNDPANNDTERGPRKNKEQESTTTSTSEQSKKMTRPLEFTLRTIR